MINIPSISEIELLFTNTKNFEELEEAYNGLLGKQGQISKIFKDMGSLEPEQKKQLGQELSGLKEQIELLYTKGKNIIQSKIIEEKISSDPISSFMPEKKQKKGHLTLLSQARRKIEDIFMKLGFSIESGDSAVTKYDNFYSLNIPSSHPATEMHDTFYLNQKDAEGDFKVLRTHTSAAQNILIKKHGVPSKFIVPGKVFRYENTDASHDTMFYQVEGVVLDENITIGHMKDLMKKLLSELFGQSIDIRMRPAFFPFVEPGFEIDASCPICQQKGCSLCKNTGWIEILGAGIIHPKVLQNAGVDTDKFSGFAFGLGLNRMVGIMNKINDIRLFTSGDLKFIRSRE